MDIEVELILCPTPKTMTIALCKDCKRYTKKESENTEMFYPKQSSFGWRCDGYVNIKQRN